MSRFHPPPTSNGFAFPKEFYCLPPPPPPLGFLRPSVILQGQPAILLSSDDILALNAPTDLCLVGKFDDCLPSDDTLRLWLAGMGCCPSTRFGRWTDLSILFFLKDIHDYSKAFSETFFTLGPHLMRLTKWANNVPPAFDCPIAPVWIDFPGLPIHFFNKELLFSMASTLGRPLQLHADTFNLTRIDAARILVELDVTAPIAPSIMLGSVHEGIRQPIMTNYIPPYCTACFTLGHLQSTCPTTSTASDSTESPLDPFAATANELFSASSSRNS